MEANKTKKEMMLSKEASAEALKTYFRNIQRMEESGEQFPVNLDEVWGIVYEKKQKAINFLVENFEEGIDYVFFTQMGKKYSDEELFFAQKRKNPSDEKSAETSQLPPKTQKKDGRGRPTTNYFLSVSCLEFFIARRVRPVFEVYRSIFKAVRQGQIPPKPTFNLPLKTVGSPVEEVSMYLKEAIIREEDGEQFPIPLEDVWRLAYTNDEEPTDRLLRRGIGIHDQYKEGTDFTKVKVEGKRKPQFYINMHTLLRLLMPRSLKIQVALDRIGYKMPRHELGETPTYAPNTENSMWFLQLIGVRDMFDEAVERECARIMANDHMMRREFAMSEENEDVEERERLWELALQSAEDDDPNNKALALYSPGQTPGFHSMTDTRINPVVAIEKVLSLLTRLRQADCREAQKERVRVALEAMTLYEENLF